MWSSCRWMPDSADSVGYGTRILSARSSPTGGTSSAAAPANCHTPLRFCQRARVSCGRGYSGSALDGETWSVHRSEEHTSELQSRQYLVCRLLLEKKKKEQQ